MKKRPYAKARTTATSTRRDRLRGQMARMDAKMKAKKAEAAKKAAARKAAPAKKKAPATLGQDKKRSLSSKPAAAKRPVPPKNPRTGRARTSVDSKTNMDFDAAPRNTNPNPRARALSMQRDKTGGVKTKAGEYKVFKKKSQAAGSFRSAFATAKKTGKKTFTWNGKKYTTKTK
jgi:hypothetical protein